jgi:AcrR family transcriptional regulator
MNAASRRDREKADLRERILDATRTLLVEGGRDAVTMREVARLVDYSPAALYQYFPDKEALIHELCVGDFSKLAQIFMTLPTEGGPLAIMCRAGFAYLRFARDFPEHYRFMFMTPTAGTDPESPEEREDPARNAYVFLHAIVSAAIQAGLLREELTDAHAVTQGIWATAHGVAALEICKRDAAAWVDFLPFEERSAFALRSSVLATARDSELALRIFEMVRKEEHGD